MEKKKILVVEDEQTTATLIDSILKEHGYDIVVAHNGKIALTLLKAMQPDLIISDVIMPELNGYDFFRRIKKDENTTHIPFIMLTGHAAIGDALKEFEVDALLIKPVVAAQLLETVEGVITSEERAAPSVARDKKKEKQSLTMFVSVTAGIVLVCTILLIQFVASRWGDKKMGAPEQVEKEGLSESFK